MAIQKERVFLQTGRDLLCSQRCSVKDIHVLGWQTRKPLAVSRLYVNKPTDLGELFNSIRINKFTCAITYTKNSRKYAKGKVEHQGLLS